MLATLLTSEQKHQLVLEYGRRFGCDVLVETGTCSGDTVEACRHQFRDVYSIELSPTLHARARARFAGARNVGLVEGNSAIELAILLQRIPCDAPVLFWLDAHYSGGETAGDPEHEPLYDELRAIFASRANVVVLIDDARGLNVSETLGLVNRLTSVHLYEVEDDIIRIEPR